MKITDYIAWLKRRVGPYAFVPRYQPISGTERHCYIHPTEVATYWETNAQDKSYKRPVCTGCAS